MLKMGWVCASWRLEKRNIDKNCQNKTGTIAQSLGEISVVQVVSLLQQKQSRYK
jgi:hypothetical protein